MPIVWHNNRFKDRLKIAMTVRIRTSGESRGKEGTCGGKGGSGTRQMPRVSAAAGLLSFGWAICPSGQGRLRRREERKARCLANGAYEGSKDFTIEVCTPLSASEVHKKR
ncbi:hypothetical protein TNIN_396221 [Trichonephila inaurata madagascariensis]|uniref:Uncharacterized protein n=1 Tax=Trichonephila inaurata madagascariensis TaxID=2747483 RepID=A0A8X6X776_9ARAC|nr:hypothetical protein TNIN_396221 [Trichonephila inaurata madagascariensis]